MGETDRVVLEDLLAQCRRNHDSWINGDPSGYVLADGATIMGAFGGVGRGGPALTEQQRGARNRWLAGTGDVELIDGGVSAGVAWLVMIERASVTFAGRSEPTRWDLRVTEMFRQNGESWERFHRHADPLVDMHGFDEVVNLLA
jgi:hypothetical protein